MNLKAVASINKVAKNLLSVGFSNIASQFIAFLMIAYIARVIGKEGFGVINLAQAMITYFSIFTMFGLQTYGLREISKAKDNNSRIVSEILIIRIVLFVISYGLLLFIALLVHKDYSFKLLLVLYGVTLLPTALNTDWYFSGIQEMQHNAVYNIVRNLIPFGAVVLYVKEPGQIAYIPVFTLLGIVIATVYQYVILKRSGVKLSFRFSGTPFRRLLKSGFPFFLSGILAMVNTNIDRVVIGFSRTDSELGVYSAAYNIILFLTNVVAIIFIPVFPLLIKYYNSSLKGELLALANKIAKFIALFIIPVAVGGIILAQPIMVLLFGRDFAEAAGPFRILLVFSILLFIREIFGYQLNAWNREKDYLKVVTVSSLVNLVLNVTLTPRYGIYMAAGINIISEMINLLLMRKSAGVVVPTPITPYVLKALLPSLAMGIALVFLKAWLPVLVNILIAICIYFVFVLLFKLVTLSEIKGFLAVNKK